MKQGREARTVANIHPTNGLCLRFHSKAELTFFYSSIVEVRKTALARPEITGCITYGVVLEASEAILLDVWQLLWLFSDKSDRSSNALLSSMLVHFKSELMDSSSSIGSSAEEEVCLRKSNKRKSGKPNEDIIKGGIDGIQEGTLIHLTGLSYLPLFNDYIKAFPVIAFFTGTWCGPAREMNDLVIELSDYYITLTFIKIDLPLENHSEISKFMTHFNIRELPTFLFFYEGKQVYKLVGAFPDELIHLTHRLCMRQTLLRIKGLKAEIANSKDPFHLHKLREDLSKAEADAGPELELYKSTRVLEVEEKKKVEDKRFDH
ncbi:hypothetical protein GOP47_0022495 [Adiantum capillus-veneris]|uniref:Thioredoxin domain-containing protein n=1 Tax=Adiantum capillus-veneris TaxID=13818 RepID=A0A9D4U5H4_ADICA|nr:hypothetical protein GOP47_0022495 [Adiantum capillus-veneris]